VLTVIDMGISNLRSVVEAFRRVGAEIEVVTDIAAVERAETLVLPGVGAFRDGIASLREKGLVEPIRSHVLERGRPLVGICLGMQLLVDEGEEHGGESGLGLVPGRAVRLAPIDPSLRSTRWHGTITGIGFVRQAVPAAWVAPGWPAPAAMSP